MTTPGGISNTSLTPLVKRDFSCSLGWLLMLQNGAAIAAVAVVISASQINVIDSQLVQADARLPDWRAISLDLTGAEFPALDSLHEAPRPVASAGIRPSS